MKWEEPKQRKHGADDASLLTTFVSRLRCGTGDQDQEETTEMGKPRPGGRTIRKRGARLLGAKAAAASGEEEAVRQ